MSSSMSAGAAVVLLSQDPDWLAEAGGAVLRSGGLVLAECDDAVTLLAQAALGLLDVALCDPRIALDRDVVLKLRRRDVVVAIVGEGGDPDLAPTFRSVGDALTWAVEGGGSAGQAAHPLVAFFGSRGTPGATTVAIATAMRLALEGAPRLALVDLDPRGGTIAAHLGLTADDVVVAADAAARRQPWRYTATTGRVGLLAAPARATWSQEVAGVEIGLLLDEILRERPVLVDGGLVDRAMPDVTREVLARAQQIFVVGCASSIALTSLAQAVTLLRTYAPQTVVVLNEGRGAAARSGAAALRAAGPTVSIPDAVSVQAVVDLVRLGAEQEHQAGRGVEQHQDRHRHARRRPRPFR
ncbi:MAG: hypothetical protein ACTHOG_13210 [Marmoricola sp.]